jgi:hypothetical protein
MPVKASLTDLTADCHSLDIDKGSAGFGVAYGGFA